MNAVEAWKVIVFSAVVCNFPEEVMTRLTVHPRNITVKIGDSAYLNCSAEPSAIHWKQGDKFVYTGELVDTYSARFRIEIDSKGARNLVITSVESGDAGKYICEEVGVGPELQKSEAELIVIDKDPICQSNITVIKVIGSNSCGLELETVQFACSVSYNGNIPPELTWKRRGENATITEGVTMTTHAKTVTSISFFKANNLNDDNSSFICETTQATKLQYKCSTPVVKMLYAFSNNTTARKSIDETLVCSANASQMCSYNWKWVNDGKEVSVSNDSVLNPEKAGSYRCEAECQMRNKSCIVVSMIFEASASAPTVSENSESAMSWQWIVVPVVIITLVLCLAIAAAVHFIRKRKRTKKILSSDERKATVESIPLTAIEASNKREKEETIKKEITAESLLLTPNEAKPVTWNLSQGQEVRGLAIGDDGIYVLTYNPICVEMYDIESHTSFGSRSFSDIMLPCDMAYCKLYKRLYVMDGTKEGETKKIHLLDELHLQMTASWESAFDCGNLSVAFDYSVILAAPNAIVEYSSDGKVIRRIAIHEAVIPLCAIKIDAYSFLVSRGQRDGDVYEVCLISIAKMASTGKTHQVEKIEKSFGNKAGPKSEQLDNPRSLAVSENKDVFVLDEKNNRVLKLNSDLFFEEEIPLSKHGLQFPVKLCLSESRGQLVVVGNSVDTKDSDSGIPGILVLPPS